MSVNCVLFPPFHTVQPSSSHYVLSMGSTPAEGLPATPETLRLCVTPEGSLVDGPSCSGVDRGDACTSSSDLHPREVTSICQPDTQQQTQNASPRILQVEQVNLSGRSQGRGMKDAQVCNLLLSVVCSGYICPPQASAGCNLRCQCYTLGAYAHHSRPLSGTALRRPSC